MPEYEVWLGMRIEDAENSVDAAEQAHCIIQEPGTNWLCRVINCETKEEMIISALKSKKNVADIIVDKVYYERLG